MEFFKDCNVATADSRSSISSRDEKRSLLSSKNWFRLVRLMLNSSSDELSDDEEDPDVYWRLDMEGEFDGELESSMRYDVSFSMDPCSAKRSRRSDDTTECSNPNRMDPDTEN